MLLLPFQTNWFPFWLSLDTESKRKSEGPAEKHINTPATTALIFNFLSHSSLFSAPCTFWDAPLVEYTCIPKRRQRDYPVFQLKSEQANGPVWWLWRTGLWFTHSPQYLTSPGKTHHLAKVVRPGNDELRRRRMGAEDFEVAAFYSLPKPISMQERVLLLETDTGVALFWMVSGLQPDSTHSHSESRARLAGGLGYTNKSITRTDTLGGGRTLEGSWVEQMPCSAKLWAKGRPELKTIF